MSAKKSKIQNQNKIEPACFFSIPKNNCRDPNMEDSTTISSFCKTLTSFCNHLQTSSETLKESIERRPIPLDSASFTFIRYLNRRVTSASKDLNLLESMALNTISFEELLGHCNELHNKNQTDILELQDRFKEFGYVPEVEIEEEDDDEVSGLKTPESLISYKDGMDLHSMSSGRNSIMKRLEEDPLFNDSLNLKNLGLSDVCLATLASEAGSGIVNLRSSTNAANYDIVNPLGKEAEYPPAMRVLGAAGVHQSEDKSVVAPASVIKTISRDDYENLPSFMKNLASWEDLNVALDKMNSILHDQKKSKECNLFHPDKLSSLGLGPKVRSYLLLLVRMHRLVVETVDGSIVYRVL